MLVPLSSSTIRTEYIAYITFTVDKVNYVDAKVLSCTVYLSGGQTLVLQNKQDCEVLVAALRNEHATAIR